MLADSGYQLAWSAPWSPWRGPSTRARTRRSAPTTGRWWPSWARPPSGRRRGGRPCRPPPCTPAAPRPPASRAASRAAGSARTQHTEVSDATTIAASTCSGRQAAAQQTGLTGTDRTGQGRQRTLVALVWSVDACSHSSQRANHRPIESIMGAAAVRSAPRRQARRPTPLHSHDALGGIAAPAAPAARTARSSPSHSAVAYSCLRLARAPMY